MEWHGSTQVAADLYECHLDDGQEGWVPMNAIDHQVRERLDDDGIYPSTAATCSCGVAIEAATTTEIQPAFADHLARVARAALFAAGGTLVVRPHPKATTTSADVARYLAPAVLGPEAADGTYRIMVFGEAGLHHARNVARYCFWRVEQEIPFDPDSSAERG